MSWRLRFYRQVIQGVLPAEEVERYFAREPGGARTVLAERVAGEAGVVQFQFAAQPGGHYAFALFPPQAASPPDPDFPYDETELFLLVEPLQERAVAEEAVRRAERLCGELRLLVLDLQREGTIPLPPEHTRLVESYVAYSEDIALTIQAASRQKRRFLLLALALLALAALVALAGMTRG